MAWVAVGATVAGAVVSSAMSDDSGAEAANDAAASSSKLQAQISQDQWARYKQIYEPLERTVVSEAQNYDTPEQYAKAAGDASATVSDQFSKAREQLGRSPGLDPSSPAYQASMVGLNLAQAATDATQQNLARKNVSDTAYRRQVSALGLGKGLDTTAASGAASAVSTNQGLANAAYNRASGEAAGIGSLFGKVGNSLSTMNWSSGGAGAGTGSTVSSNQTSAFNTYGTSGGSGGADFSAEWV